MLTIELSCLYRLVIRKHIKEDRTELEKVGKDMGSTAHQSSIPLFRMASEPVRLKYVVCQKLMRGIDPAQVYILQDVPVFSQIDFPEKFFLSKFGPLI